MEIKENVRCDCNKITCSAPQLAQSLFIIQAYTLAFAARIHKNKIDFNEMSLRLKKIDNQIEIMGNIIRSMTFQ